MKHLPLLFVVATLFSVQYSYADTDSEPTQVELVAVLTGSDAGTVLKGQGVPVESGQPVRLPKVTTKSGRTAVVKVVREFPYPVDFDAAGIPTAFDTSNLGVTLTIKPYIVMRRINFSGNLSLVTVSGTADSNLEVPTICTSEKFFSGKAKSGEQIEFSTLSPSGGKVTLSLTFMLMDSQGRPVD